MFCPNCGNQLEDGSRFCPACGNPVTSEGTQQGAQNTSGSTQNQYTRGCFKLCVNLLSGVE